MQIHQYVANVVHKCTPAPLFCHVPFMLCMMMLFFCFTPVAISQVSVSAVISDTSPAAGEILEITLLSDEVDFYSAALEVNFNNSLFEFLSVSCTGLSEGGIMVAGELNAGRVGASVSKTSPLPFPETGAFMVLSFRVKPSALAVLSEFIFTDFILLNSAGEQVPAANIPSVSVNIDATITDISILIPAPVEVDEGVIYNVGGYIYASGATENDRIICQIGINSSCTDPATWNEGVWQDMLYEESDENHYLYYISEIASSRPPGEWSIAIRASIDGGSFVYGGIDGIWHLSDSPCGSFKILPRPPFRYEIANWDFNTESLLPVRSIFENRNEVLQVSGASLSGFSSGASGFAANSNNWHDGAGVKSWVIGISTTGLSSLQLSSRQYGSGTGPRDFAVQYSQDGNSWVNVENGGVVVGTNWSSGTIDKLPLPILLENKNRIFLRWVVTSEVSISEGTTGPSGTNRIDDIVVTGVNPAPETVVVHPGDANNDGIVNADDVLPLGAFWMVTGPPAPVVSPGFVFRTIENWIPFDATFADTNGDGTIDHKDLMAIGLHFGKTTSAVTKDSTRPLSVLEVDPLEGGRIKKIMVTGTQSSALRGVSFSIEMDGIPEDMWEIRDIFPAFTGDTSEGSILSFEITERDLFEGAFASIGSRGDFQSTGFAGFDLVISDAWDGVFKMQLNRLTVSNANSTAIRLEEGELALMGSTSASGPDNLTEELLMQNYPNPFTSVTTIPFTLNYPSEIRIEVIDVRGGLVFSGSAGFRERGTHEVLFNGQTLDPGMYFCRIITSEGCLGVIKMFRTDW